MAEAEESGGGHMVGLASPSKASPVNVRAKDSGGVIGLLWKEAFLGSVKSQHSCLFSPGLSCPGSYFSGRAVNLLYIPDG